MKQSTRKAIDKAVFEVLEDRDMMSASPTAMASVSNGTLNLTGDANAATRVTVDYGADANHLSVNVGNVWKTFSTTGIKKIVVTAGSGNDYVYMNPNITIPMSVSLGNGNDIVRTGAGNDTIVVGNGNDLIYGKIGNNSITTGNGNDTLMGDRGNDSLTVGNGDDYLVGGGGTNVIKVGTGSDSLALSLKTDKLAINGHNITLSGLKNGYLYTKAGALTAPAAATSVSGTPPKTTGTTTTPVVTAPSTPTKPATGPTTGSTKNTSTGSTTTGSTKNTSTGSTTTGSTKNTSTGSTTGGTGGTTKVGSTPTQINPDAPVPHIVALAGTRQTGVVVNVDGLTSKLVKGTDLQAQYSWNFGDTSSSSNQLTGFNAAHVYDNPGTYTVSLTVTNAAGLSATTTQSITIAASTRNVIYVDSSAGSDSNNGSAAHPLKSVAAAFNELKNGTEILLKAGQKFNVTASLHVGQQNVVVGRYGTGADPILNRISGNGTSTIAIGGGTNGFTISHVTFDSPYGVAANAQAPKIGVSGIYVAGTNIAITDCTFLNVDDAINENGNPVGVLVQGNSAPLTTGLRGYFVWGQGAEQVINDNFAANSTREHILRMVDLTEVSITNNTFSNLDRTKVDPHDASKGCIEIHRGADEWISDNSVTGGDIRIGPLGLWGESPTSSTDNAVIEDNQLTDTMIFVMPGSHNAMIEGNVINNATGQAIIIDGEDSVGRISSNITIVNNTATTSGTCGNFLRVNGWATQITLTNNLWVAPRIQLGSNGTAPVYVNYANLKGFTLIGNNVWPAPTTIGTWAHGGINFIGTTWQSSGYQSPSQWDAQSAVEADTFQNVSLDGSYSITMASQVAGASLKMAA